MLRFKTIREYESKTKKREKTSIKTDKIKEQNEKWLQIFKTTSKLTTMAPQLKLTTTASKPTKKKIFFNSKIGGGYKLLSNFYGTAEFNFHLQRFKGEVLPNLLSKVFKSTRKDASRFLAILKQLQPGKKWTDRKQNYWMNEGRPITGILAKLIMNKCKRISVRSSGWKKDLSVLQSVAKDFGIELSLGDFALHDQSRDVNFMRAALYKKYSKVGKYRNLLLSTGNSDLHEFGRRPSRWTFTKSGEGGDLLGKLLTEVRDKLARE